MVMQEADGKYLLYKIIGGEKNYEVDFLVFAFLGLFLAAEY